MIPLQMTEEEARWLRNILGKIAGRYDDPEALVLQRRVDGILSADAPRWYVTLVREGSPIFAIPLTGDGRLAENPALQPPPWSWMLRPGDRIEVLDGGLRGEAIGA